MFLGWFIKKRLKTFPQIPELKKIALRSPLVTVTSKMKETYFLWMILLMNLVCVSFPSYAEMWCKEDRLLHWGTREEKKTFLEAIMLKSFSEKWDHFYFYVILHLKRRGMWFWTEVWENTFLGHSSVLAYNVGRNSMGSLILGLNTASTT